MQRSLRQRSEAFRRVGVLRIVMDGMKTIHRSSKE
jgi:hypothetical protein